MSRIISDFIKSAGVENGYGYFNGKKEVSKYAQEISTNQKNKFKRYGKIPRAFLNYYEALSISDPNEAENLRLDLLNENSPGAHDNPIDSPAMLYKRIVDDLTLYGNKHLQHLFYKSEMELPPEVQQGHVIAGRKGPRAR